MSVSVNTVQSSRGIYVPKYLQSSRLVDLCNRSLKQLVETADSACFHYYIRLACSSKGGPCAVVISFIDYNLRPVWIFDVAVLLPVIYVRFIEGDPMPFSMKRLDDAAIIGRRPIPISRHKAGAKERDI